MSAKFGPAGNSDCFKSLGYKSSLDIARIISSLNLDCYEYQCGRGVNISQQKAEMLGQLCKEQNVALSIHAPYYISLASEDEAKRDNSINYILQSARAADYMGATRIVVHPGGKGKFTRQEAMSLALDTFKRSIKALDENNLGHIIICPETMGKINQLGDLDEIIEFCKCDERVIPCIDFGHLNSRTFGSIKDKNDFAKIIEKIENELGSYRAKNFHTHFSKIEWSQGGEVKHLTFEDVTFGPRFEPFIEYVLQKDLTPVVICESAGTQAEDAKMMKDYYLSKGVN